MPPYSTDIPMPARLPRLRLLQGSRQDWWPADGNPGDWCVGSFLLYPPILMVPLGHGMERKLFSATMGEQPLCSSHDTITGVGDPGGDCKTCPKAKRNEGAAGSKERAACTFSLLFPVWLCGAAMPAEFATQRTSLQAGFTIRDAAWQHQGWGKFHVEVGSGQMDTAFGKVFVPTITVKAGVPEGMPLSLADAYRDGAVALAALEEAPVTAEAIAIAAPATGLGTPGGVYAAAMLVGVSKLAVDNRIKSKYGCTIEDVPAETLGSITEAFERQARPEPTPDDLPF